MAHHIFGSSCTTSAAFDLSVTRSRRFGYLPFACRHHRSAAHKGVPSTVKPTLILSQPAIPLQTSVKASSVDVPAKRCHQRAKSEAIGQCPYSQYKSCLGPICFGDALLFVNLSFLFIRRCLTGLSFSRLQARRWVSYRQASTAAAGRGCLTKIRPWP
jgi:hypothetical protein